MLTTIPNIDGSLLDQPEHIRHEYRLLKVRYQTDDADARVIKKCLFSHETHLSDITDVAYFILMDYLEEVSEGNRRALPQPDEADLTFGVIRKDNIIHYIMQADDHEHLLASEVAQFVNELNKYASTL